LKKLLLAAISVLVSVIFVSGSFSQLRNGHSVLGATFGFSSKSSSIILGTNYEYMLPQSGVGLFSVGAMSRYWTASEELSDKSGKFEYTNFAVAGQMNYNFNQIGKGTFVPFVGLVLGFNSVGSKYTSFNNSTNSIIGYEQKYKNGLFMWGQGGMRIFASRKIAGVVRLGLGNFDLSTIEVGFDYKF
jgi:hypothetical protein